MTPRGFQGDLLEEEQAPQRTFTSYRMIQRPPIQEWPQP